MRNVGKSAGAAHHCACMRTPDKLMHPMHKASKQGVPAQQALAPMLTEQAQDTTKGQEPRGTGKQGSGSRSNTRGGWGRAQQA